MTSLLAIKGPNMGVRYELADATRIGRGEENEICVADPNVSRVHAEIIRNRMSYSIYDRESRNGILVNGAFVPEKVLLRNDEITIGNTVFLFNSDLNIQNARFTDNSVYFYPASEETVEIARRESHLEALTGRERESVEFILRFSEIFAAPPQSTSETAERLLTHLVQLFSADHAVLLAQKGDDAALIPVAALPRDQAAAINKQVIAAVAQDRHCLISADSAWQPEGDQPQSGKAEHSTMFGPVIDGDELLAVIVVGKEQPNFFSLRDLGLLQAVTRLAAGMLEASSLVDKTTRRSEATDGRLFVSRNTAVQEIFHQAATAAQSNVTILITGESGTGKEILAQHIHKSGPQREGPFIAVNCGAIPANLFEAELFGYERGAFTGAVRTTPGKVEAAENGTLFLDEIGELPLELQPKLLRFIQERVFFRVGGNRAIKVPLRIVAATNMDLEQATAEGRFRQDLLFRLNVIRFELPPLRDRREDIAPLADFIVSKISVEMRKQVLGINSAATILLEKHQWPGNIRELENAIGRAVILSRGKILQKSDFTHIEDAIRRHTADEKIAQNREITPLAELEKQHILQALRITQWSHARAAEALGIHRNTLRNKIAEYRLEAHQE